MHNIIYMPVHISFCAQTHLLAEGHVKEHNMPKHVETTPACASSHLPELECIQEDVVGCKCNGATWHVDTIGQRACA